MSDLTWRCRVCDRVQPIDHEGMFCGRCLDMVCCCACERAFDNQCCRERVLGLVVGALGERTQGDADAVQLGRELAPARVVDLVRDRVAEAREVAAERRGGAGEPVRLDDSVAVVAEESQLNRARHG